MSKKILTVPDPKLRQKAEKVHVITDDVLDTIADMRKFSLEWEKSHPHELSAAMAAPQIGAMQKIIILRDSDDKDSPDFVALINPEITKLEGRVETNYEGCLSVPRIYGLVPRNNKIRVKALLEDGREVRLKASGQLARTILHEVDHLNGVLFIDHIRGEKNAFFELNNKGDLVPLDYDTEIAENKDLWGDE